jgi:tetratricopeptide (TPR) repeat protein
MPRCTAATLFLLPGLVLAQMPSAKVLDRYRQMLVSRPEEGTALDRLWQAYAEQGRSGALLAEFAQEPTYAGQMIHGLLLKKAGRNAEAITAFQSAFTHAPGDPAPALALAKLEAAAGHPAQAVIWLEKAIELLPSDDARRTAALLELGAAQLAAGEPEKAAEAWEKTIAASPGDLGLRRQLADTYARHQLGRQAIPHLEYLEQHAPPAERAQALQQMAAIHQVAGEQDAAIRALEKALAGTAPGNWLRGELQAQLVRLHQRYHRVPELEVKWRRAAEENPRDLGALLQLVDLYEKLGEQAQQLAWLERLVAAAPKNHEYRLRFARLLAQLDQLDRAAAAYDALLGAEPRNIDLVFERARIDVQRDQPAAAGERLAALLARASDDEGVRAQALEFYQVHRLHDLAEKHLREDAAGGSEDALLALATFYFSRQRETEARQVLDRLIRPADAPERQAAAHFRIAETLKAQNDVAGAAAALRASLALHEAVRDAHFMLGELETAAGRHAGAEVAFERAFALSKTPAEALEADQRLYDALRQQKEAHELEPRTGLPRPDAAAEVTSAAAQGYLLKLTRAAVEAPSEEKWLRVARWQQWSRNQRGAVDAAERAIALNPKSIAAHDFLARLYAADVSGPGGQTHLRKLIELDPANRAAYLRRLGQIELQTARTDDALGTFQRLTQENPGDLDALADLALAQQRAEQWNEAIATLRQLYELSPASKKREAVNSLLRIYERLAMRTEAAQLLLAQIDAEAEAKDRLALFNDLLALCTRHGLLDWLRAQCEQRRKVRVDDYFTEVALGRVLKAQGNKAAAFEVLSDAAFSAPNPGEALPELVREAEELRRFDAAIRLQTQFVRVVPQTGPEGLERLAQLQEKNLQPDEAGKTWARLVQKYPRDVQVLEKAADFERAWGTPERALALLRRLCAIEPVPRVLAQLAELNLTEGDPAEAAQCFEQILAMTTPEKPGGSVRYPAVRPESVGRFEMAYRRTVSRRSGRVSAAALRALREFWFEKKSETRPGDDTGVRLQTIRDLAQTIAARGSGAEVARWIERWRQPGTGVSERLWALYFANANGPLLDEVEALAASDEGEVARNAFIWLALQTGEFARLAAWLGDAQRTPPERDYFMVAFAQYLEMNRQRMSPDLVGQLFPEGFRSRLIQAAGDFAGTHHYREAVQLGTRILRELPGPRPRLGYELARWHVQLGEIAPAREALRACLAEPGESLAAPVYAALRALYLLLPPAEQAAFAQEVESTLDERLQPLHTLLTRTLLAGLSGDEKTACAVLDRLLALRVISRDFGDERATAATRHWDYLLGAGAQLAAWQLDTLAIHLWSRALSDEAAVALQFQLPEPQGNAVRARVTELRTRLAALRLVHADAADYDEILAEYARHASPEGLIPLAETLEAMNANPIAVMVYRRMWELEPANPHALRNAVAACRSAGDFRTLEAILARVVGEGLFRANEATHRDLVQQLAEVLEQRGEYQRARLAILEILPSAPRDARLQLKLASLHERSGQRNEAEAAYRRLLGTEPANVAARLSLAALLDAGGEVSAAIDVLERASGSEIDARLAALNLKAGRREEALAALERVPPADHARAALTVAELLVGQGDPATAQLVLRASLLRTVDEASRYLLQARLLRLLPADADRAVIAREVRRTQRAAEAEPGGGHQFYELMQTEALRLGLGEIHRAQMVRDWNEGRGDLEAGVALLAAQNGAEAATTWRQIAQHAALDAATLSRVVALLATQEPALAIEAAGRLARSEANEAKHLGDWARRLSAAGRKGEALTVAGELAARAVFQPELAAAAADAFAGLGEASTARAWAARAVRADPAARQPEVYFSYARMLLQAGEVGSARLVLKNAARNPASAVVPEIVAYLAATRRMEAHAAEVADFPLEAEQRTALRRAVAIRLAEGGNWATALALAEEHPDLLDAALAARLRAGAKADYARCAGLFERALAQGAPLAEETALVFTEWGESALAVLQTEEGRAHFQRAHELAPALWPAAERLAGLQLDRGEAAQAAATLKAFLDASKDEPARTQARQLLARIPVTP